MVAEMFTLAAQKNVEKGLPGFRLQQWYFFFCAAFFGYGRMLSPNLLAEVAENAWLPGVIGAPRCATPLWLWSAARRNPTVAPVVAPRCLAGALLANAGPQRLHALHAPLPRGTRERADARRCADAPLCSAAVPRLVRTPPLVRQLRAVLRRLRRLRHVAQGARTHARGWR